MDIRKYGIVIAVAILSAIFIYAMADAISGEKPEYQDCWRNRISADGYAYPEKAFYQGREVNCTVPAMDIEARDACTADKGEYLGVQGQDGCIVSYECSYCNRDFQNQQQERNEVFFYTSIALGLIFIIVGFMLPLGTIHEYVGLGLIFGGIIGLFIGTVAYWSDLSRWLRPIVIALELAVLLFIIYRRMRTEPTVTEKAAVKKARRKR